MAEARPESALDEARRAWERSGSFADAERYAAAILARRGRAPGPKQLLEPIVGPFATRARERRLHPRDGHGASPGVLPFDLCGYDVQMFQWVETALFAVAEAPYLIVPDPAGLRTAPLRAVMLPEPGEVSEDDAAALRDLILESRRPQSHLDQPGAALLDFAPASILRVDLHAAIHAHLLGLAASEAGLDDAALVELMTLLDLIHAHLGRGADDLVRPEVVLGWGGVSAEVRETAARRGRWDPKLEPWERGRASPPPARVVGPNGVRALAYASKILHQDHGTGWDARVSRLELHLDREDWSFTRSDLWWDGEPGIEFS